MSGANGEMRGANNTTALETISAAATAIASAENRVRQASVEKRRWGSRWSISWCFGSQKHHKHTKRIGHAVLVPESAPAGAEVPTAEIPTQAPAVVFPFIAPPSSPASFFHSEPTSCAQSPGGLLSLTSISASMYSPGPASMFAIGPYAHETQLVSPPVFSTFTTEPSTAPFTPPPESVQFTTPSSPEVPYARLLDPNHQNGVAVQRFPSSQYEFQSYHVYPRSPVGHLISPSSGISGSGTSSPFPDCELTPGSLTPDSGGPRSRNNSLLVQQNSGFAPPANSFNGGRNYEAAVDHRVSFEITADDVVRCMAKEPYLAKAVSPFGANAEVTKHENSAEAASSHEGHLSEIPEDTTEKASSDGEDGQRSQRHRSITLGSIKGFGSVKEFNFDSADGGKSDKQPSIGSDWWANEKVVGNEGGSSKNWSFFPLMQPGVS